MYSLSCLRHPEDDASSGQRPIPASWRTSSTHEESLVFQMTKTYDYTSGHVMESIAFPGWG